MPQTHTHILCVCWVWCMHLPDELREIRYYIHMPYTYTQLWKERKHCVCMRAYICWVCCLYLFTWRISWDKNRLYPHATNTSTHNTQLWEQRKHITRCVCVCACICVDISVCIYPIKQGGFVFKKHKQHSHKYMQKWACECVHVTVRTCVTVRVYICVYSCVCVCTCVCNGAGECTIKCTLMNTNTICVYY